MTNIIGLDLATDLLDETRVFVNADTITHWHHNKKGQTKVFLTSGESVTVTDCPWDILGRIEPEPDYSSDDDDSELLETRHFVLNGELTPGSQVYMHTVMQYANGSIRDFYTTATMDKTEESGGIPYHYFRDGILDGIPEIGFGWPAHQFQVAG